MATGSRLSFADIQQLWIANGGPAGWAPLMAGIALAESGGSTVALNNNPSTGDYSVGLWQINYYGNLLASRTNSYGSPAALQADPNLQAKAAIALLGGGPGITNWKGDATYNKWVAAGSPSQPSAATVQGWSGSGAATGSSTATTASGSAAASSSGAPSGASGNDLSDCVIKAPGLNVIVFSLGGQCILSKGGLKWLEGAAALVLGGAIGVFGVIILAAWGLDASGAKQTVQKVAKTAGIGGALAAGQPEVAAGVAAASKSTGSSKKAAPKSPEIPTAGRRESRQIERNYQSSVRQQGPIGPRGANPTANRVAARKRAGTSVPGPRRRQPPNVPGGRPF